MTDQEYKQLVVMEHVRKLKGFELDAVLAFLGYKPEKMRSPLPDTTLMEELDGLA